MDQRITPFTVLVATALLVHPCPTRAGECSDPQGLCADPCPGQGSCRRDSDCPKPLVCRPACLPSSCICTHLREWACTADCLGECRLPPPRANPPRYVIIDLGTLGGLTSVALGINNKGQVAGGADTAQGWRHAYLWDAGSMTDLGTISPTLQSEAWDINIHGEVVGISTNTGDPEFAFLWLPAPAYGLPAGINDLGNLGYFGAEGIGINDVGQVVGSSFVSRTALHAFLWQAGTMSDLGTLGGPRSIAWDINLSAQVVGSSYTGSGQRAFLWHEGVMQDLGSLGPGASEARGINDSSVVVGTSGHQAFLWLQGQMTDLGAMGGFTASLAEAINQRGEVVGGPQFLYDPKEGFLDLEYVLPRDAPWVVLDPRDINDLSQIVGSGRYRGIPRAFLMTPIDADFDNDADVDSLDFAALRACMTGPGGRSPNADCKDRDIDRDGDIDMMDFRAYAWVVNAH